MNVTLSFNIQFDLCFLCFMFFKFRFPLLSRHDLDQTFENNAEGVNGHYGLDHRVSRLDELSMRPRSFIPPHSTQVMCPGGWERLHVCRLWSSVILHTSMRGCLSVTFRVSVDGSQPHSPVFPPQKKFSVIICPYLLFTVASLCQYDSLPSCQFPNVSPLGEKPCRTSERRTLYVKDNQSCQYYFVYGD